MPRTIPAAHFCQTLAENVDNDHMSDAEFRDLARNTLPIVILKPRTYNEGIEEGLAFIEIVGHDIAVLVHDKMSKLSKKRES